MIWGSSWNFGWHGMIKEFTCIYMSIRQNCWMSRVVRSGLQLWSRLRNMKPLHDKLGGPPSLVMAFSRNCLMLFAFHMMNVLFNHVQPRFVSSIPWEVLVDPHIMLQPRSSQTPCDVSFSTEHLNQSFRTLKLLSNDMYLAGACKGAIRRGVSEIHS